MTSCERDSGMNIVRLGAGVDVWRISQYDDNASIVLNAMDTAIKKVYSIKE